MKVLVYTIVHSQWRIERQPAGLALHCGRAITRKTPLGRSDRFFRQEHQVRTSTGLSRWQSRLS